MSMFIDEIKRHVPVGSQSDEKLISRELRKESYRQLTDVFFDGRNIVLVFGEDSYLKKKNRVIQLSKKKHKTEKDVSEMMKKENANNTWKILKILEFSEKWLVFLTG